MGGGRSPAGGDVYIADWLDTHPGARLVVIDVFTKVRGKPADGTSSAYEADYAAVGKASSWPTPTAWPSCWCTTSAKPAPKTSCKPCPAPTAWPPPPTRGQRVRGVPAERT